MRRARHPVEVDPQLAHRHAVQARAAGGGDLRVEVEGELGQHDRIAWPQERARDGSDERLRAVPRRDALGRGSHRACDLGTKLVVGRDRVLPDRLERVVHGLAHAGERAEEVLVPVELQAVLVRPQRHHVGHRLLDVQRLERGDGGDDEAAPVGHGRQLYGDARRSWTTAGHLPHLRRLSFASHCS